MSPIQLPPPTAQGVVILVSGWRRIGKTTLLLRMRAAALDAGLQTGGFLSVARFEDGTKTGIDLLDAATGQRRPLATVGGKGPVQTGHYTFDPAALEAGLQFAADGQNADVYFIDELGPLELKRGEGWAAVVPWIRARTFGVTFVVVRPELVDLAHEKLALDPGTAVLNVDEANRDDLTSQLCAWIRQR